MTILNKYIEENKIQLNEEQQKGLKAKKLSRILRNCSKVHSHYTLSDEVQESVFCITSSFCTYLITCRKTGDVYFERLYI